MAKKESSRLRAGLLSRRGFIKGSAAGTVSLWSLARQQKGLAQASVHQQATTNAETGLDLSPARWVWYPSGRTLANTFVLFRRTVNCTDRIVSARGWVLGDSRYVLTVNGQRVQFGPAPSDPRWAEADPVDLAPYLKAGKNVIGCTVLYYGHGDGTWPAGKPGLIINIMLEFASGAKHRIVTDNAWQCMLATSWRPGQYKRWYLRALQEEFDARLYPYDWDTPEFKPDSNWLPAMQLDCPANKPVICSTYPDYRGDSSGDLENCELRARQIPHMLEEMAPVFNLAEAFYLQWQRPVREYFDLLTPNAFLVDKQKLMISDNADGRGFDITVPADRGLLLTFALDEQIVGWPGFTIHAPEGTVVELLTHEAHQVGGPVLLNTHFNAWTRFICREGENTFESFDFESLRWLQLHIHNTEGRVTISRVQVRRRQYPWPHIPNVRCSDVNLQALLQASVNTLHNSAQETIVDGMGRERQQYSGDVGHQLHALCSGFGEIRLPARYLQTFSQGMTKDGFFLDCWPAYDRLARLSQRQLDLTPWGPLLDHGIGFVFDCYHYYMYTGDIDALAEVYRRLLKFTDYLAGLVGLDGLLPVENIGVPWVWMDTDAFQQQRHKKCAFNLYVITMLRHALAPLCTAFDDERLLPHIRELADDLQSAAIRTFWSSTHRTFVNNLPWLSKEEKPRFDDRSIAMALLYNLCPRQQYQKSLALLAEPPSNMGLSYPANAGWRLWALAAYGRMDAVFKDFDTRWAGMASVKLNNTLQEAWDAKPDSGAQWSHCPVAPLYITLMDIAGIRPLTAGFEQYQVRPQLGRLTELDVTVHTIHGHIRLQATGGKGNRVLEITTPALGQGILIVDSHEHIDLPRAETKVMDGLQALLLPANTITTIQVYYN